MENDFAVKLKNKMDSYAHGVYDATKKFPRDEIFGVTSQLRRASLSVVLNYIEGFARKRAAVKKNFWEISYGSLKESKYLLQFSLVEKYIALEDHNKLMDLSEEIGAMLWKSMESIKQ